MRETEINKRKYRKQEYAAGLGLGSSSQVIKTTQVITPAQHKTP